MTAATVAATPETLLRAQGIAVAIHGVPVLRGVDLDVRAGEVVGLIGPNGAGKSTVLRALTAVLPCTGGIEIAGRALGTLDRRTLARTVAVVQQLPEAPPTMTVEELTLLGRTPYLGLLARESARDHAIAAGAMQRAGCAHLAARMLGTLSGGQRRRAFIARALAQEAPLLLLDEPTANLDVQAQCEIFELVRELAAGGVGVMVVVHDLTLAATYCDRLLMLDAGRVVAAGAPREVVTAEHVRRVYGARVTVITDSRHPAPIVVPVAADESEAGR